MTLAPALPAGPAPRPPWSPAERLAVFGAVVLIWAAAVAAYQIAGLTIPWDAKSQFYNFFRFVGRALAAGEWPLWNPYHFSGFPSVADPQSLLFSPTFLAAAWLAPNASVGAFDALVLAHLAMGAAATAGLAQRRGLAPEAAVLAAAVVFLGGPAMGRLQHVGLVVSYAYLPLCLLILETALARRSYVHGVAFALAAAVMALGRDQVAFLNSLVLVAAALAQGFSAPRPGAWFLSRAPLVLLMGAVGAAVLALPLLLTLQFAAFSNRPMVAFETAAYGSLDPFNLIGLFAAGFFGGLEKADLYFGPGSPAWPRFDWTDRSVNFLHVGAATSVLLAWIGLGRGAWLDARLRFFGGLALASLLYALGAHTPLFRFVFDWVPGIALYRRPADATFLLVLALAMLAAGSLDAVIGSGRRPTRRLLLAGLAAVTAGALAVALARAPSLAHLKAALAALGAALGAGALAVFLVGRIETSLSRWPAVALVALAAGELLVRNVATPINAEPKSVYAVFSDAPSPDRDALQNLLGALAADHAAGRRPRVEILGPENGWQNAGMTYGIESTLGYNPLRFALYERATGAAETAHEPRLRPFPKTFRGYRSRLARLLGIEIVMFDQPFERMPAGLPRPRIRVLRAGPPYWIYRLPPAAPRAMLAARFRRVDVEAVLAAGEIPEVDIASEVLLAKHDPVEAVAAATGDPGRPAPGRVAITGYRLNAVTLVAETEAPTILVLHDLDYPGWVVRVNGERRPLLRANVLFRGVELAPGHHEVEFSFEPFGRDNLLAALATLRRR